MKLKMALAVTVALLAGAAVALLVTPSNPSTASLSATAPSSALQALGAQEQTTTSPPSRRSPGMRLL